MMLQALLVWLTLGFAPAPLPRPPSGDLQKMQGDWKAVAWSMETWDMGPHPRGGLSVVCLDPRACDGTSILIVGNRLSIRPSRGSEEDRPLRVGRRRAASAPRQLRGRREEWLLRVAGARSPRRLDIAVVGGGRTMRGIYKLEGDTLTVCYARPGKPRPREFHNREQWLLVLKRKKP
jgi:hypothetical protein